MEIRQAIPEEIAYYEEILYPFQDKIFALIQSEMFYLSGGTCLSRFYYHHRFSDDLDLIFKGLFRADFSGDYSSDRAALSD